MSDKDIDQATPADEKKAEEERPAKESPEEERPVEEESPEATATSPKRGGTAIALLSFLIALTLAGWVAWQDRQAARDTSLEERVAQFQSRLSESAESLEELAARIEELGRRDPLVDAELDALERELDERIGPLSSLPARMSTLESQVASLAGISQGARDTWVLAEAEYYMQIANAQLQLASNPHLAMLALRMADERIVQLSNPGLTDVRRAIADELAALEVMDKPDVAGATLTLASLAHVVDSLPLASETQGETEGGIDPELSGAARAWASLKNALSGLVTVKPREEAKLVTLTPDAEFFLRSNLALQLQAARLALLRGEQAIFEQSMEDTTSLLHDYFDLSSAQVASALQTIAEVRSQVFTTDAPDISASLELLRQYRALNENAQ